MSDELLVESTGTESCSQPPTKLLRTQEYAANLGQQAGEGIRSIARTNRSGLTVARNKAFGR